MKPGWQTVHVPCESDPRLCAASIVMVKVCVAVTPSASLMLTEPEEKVPVAVGVPVKLIVLPLKTAVRPVGRPLEAVSV